MFSLVYNEVDALEINPGGRLSLEQIIGREREIDRYWDVLGRQGLVLSSERRLGKTHILFKMHEIGRDGFVTFYQDLEKVHSPLEFVRSLYTAVSSHLSKSGKAKKALIDAWAKVGPKKIKELDVPQARDNWKGLLSVAIDDILAVIPQDHKVVFFWDELPLMLHTFHKREGADVTIQLLDLLRALRQGNGERLRFLFTGSIGLHLVLRALKAVGSISDPINDMFQETVPPMADEEAREVATRLLLRVRPFPGDIAPLAESIVQAVGGFPYYIHHVADRLNMIGRPIKLADVDQVVGELVSADQDPAHFGHNIDRIRIYYSPEEARISFTVLDIVASGDKPPTLPQLINLVRHKHVEVTDDQVRDVCTLLQKDHYLARNSGPEPRAYDFRWKLLKQWWKGARS